MRGFFRVCDVMTQQKMLASKKSSRLVSSKRKIQLWRVRATSQSITVILCDLTLDFLTHIFEREIHFPVGISSWYIPHFWLFSVARFPFMKYLFPHAVKARIRLRKSPLEKNSPEHQRLVACVKGQMLSKRPFCNHASLTYQYELGFAKSWLAFSRYKNFKWLY